MSTYTCTLCHAIRCVTRRKTGQQSGTYEKSVFCMFTSNVSAKSGMTITSPARGGCSPFSSISEPCLFAGSLRHKQHFCQKYAATGWTGKPCFARSIAGCRISLIDNLQTKVNTDNILQIKYSSLYLCTWFFPCLIEKKCLRIDLKNVNDDVAIYRHLCSISDKLSFHLNIE